MTTARQAGGAGSASELHVSSILVRARPERGEAIARAIDAMPEAEVPARGEGRLVATIVTASERAILATMEAIRDLPGVLSAELVFHCIDPEEGPP